MRRAQGWLQGTGFKRRLAAWGVLGAVFGAGPGLSADVPEGRDFTQRLPGGETWTWSVTRVEFNKHLVVRSERDQTTPILKADITGCSFCDGEEDNCTENGVKIVTLDGRPGPVVQVVCHVGAHGQRLMVFDPRHSLSEPVLQRTGSYWIAVRTDGAALSMAYDRPASDDACAAQGGHERAFCTVQETWPQADDLQSRPR